MPVTEILTQEIIRTKRDGYMLNQAQLHAFIGGVTRGTVTDAQIAAFCMACFTRGLEPTETALLTREMVASGTTLQWHMDKPVIDKHSTGGVGDKVSLMLAAMAAACGLAVPMIAGRGLGHTGGTIDKLEAIPQFSTSLDIPHFQQIVGDVGCAIMGQTHDIAPADKRLYAVRDVTATVESIPLITASILSKKLAAGLQGLVLDVKWGNGAFMATQSAAQELATSLETVAQHAGLKARAVLTDMNSVLGHAAGNTVEVIEAIAYLDGTRRDARLHQVTLLLTAEMLILGGIEATLDAAKARAQQALDSGAAYEIFLRMVSAQGGTASDKLIHTLPAAPVCIDIVADRDGMLREMDTRGIGMLLVGLKAGRARVEDKIDPRVGFTDIAPLGTKCEAGKTLLARAHLAVADDIAFVRDAFLKLLAF